MKKACKLILLLIIISTLQACSNESPPLNEPRQKSSNESLPLGIQEGKISSEFYSSIKKWNSSYNEITTVFKKSKMDLLFIHRSSTEEQMSIYSDEYLYLLDYKNKWDHFSNDLLWKTKTTTDETILNAIQNLEYSLENYLNQTLIFLKNNGENISLDAATRQFEQNDSNFKDLLVIYTINK